MLRERGFKMIFYGDGVLVCKKTINRKGGLGSFSIVTLGQGADMIELFVPKELKSVIDSIDLYVPVEFEVDINKRVDNVFVSLSDINLIKE